MKKTAIGRLAPTVCVLALVAGLLALALWHGVGDQVTSAGATTGGSTPTAGDSFVPELGLPATGVVAFGASPEEHPGETWAYGVLGPTPATVAGQDYSNQFTLLERNNESPDWQIVPLPPGSEGKPLTGTNENEGPPAYGALAGQATAEGGVVLLVGQHIVARNPEKQPTLVPQPSEIVEAGSSSSSSSTGEAGVLEPGESLLPPHGSGSSVTVPYAAIEEEGARATGLLVAPYHDGESAPASSQAPFGVLHYDGREPTGEWTREPIAVPAGEHDGFAPLALACGGAQADPQGSSPTDCWLLASYSPATAGGASRLALFRRLHATGAPGWTWQPQAVSDWMLGEAPPPSGVSSVSVAPLAQGAQMLTATAQGVWVDFQASINGEAASSDVSELVLNPEGEAGSHPAAVDGTWCYPSGVICASTRSLGAFVPARYRSFAWTGVSPSDLGTRVITGLQNRAMLEFSGESFKYEVGAGGETGLDPGGAALFRSSEQSPVEGWIADGVYKENDGADGEGQSQAIELTPTPEGDQLQEETVPFRHPLLALSQAPGSTPGDPGAEAVAVGLQGQIGRYTPSQGWRPESLYNSAGAAQTPTLRGVAWPEPSRIYAVGDNGAMWLWRAETGLWESDPAKPFNFIGNLTAIAFDPGEPQLGYAVGKQGALLKYGKSWEQVPLPAELQQANFTSIAFAGGEALATYRTLTTEKDGSVIETGGVAVEEAGDGLHWHVDAQAGELLAQLPSPREALLSKVAGLPDGGAVAGGPGLVIERESAQSGWRFSAAPLPEAQSVSAIAAYREPGGPVRAIVSVELDRALNPGEADGNLQHGPFDGDVPPATGAGQPPVFLAPDPLPDTGYLLKETANGWVDMEHRALPVKQGGNDLPTRPDPVLAVLADEAGNAGLTVGGQTYDGGGGGPQEEAETAAAQRFPAAAGGQSGASTAPVEGASGQANFLVAGRAACGGACASLANESIGPDVWLSHALQMADQISTTTSGLDGFLYTGGRLPDNITSAGGEGLSAEAFQRELERYKELLSNGGPVTAFPAPSSDVEPVGIGSGPFAGTVRPSEGGAYDVKYGPAGTAAYSAIFPPAEQGSRSLKLVVLDYSSGELGAAQQHWLAQELPGENSSSTPTIVMGSDALNFKLPQGAGAEEAKDATAVSEILVSGHASAYIFDYPSNNIATNIEKSSIPAYGTGTLGYVEVPGVFEHDSLGSSGILLLSVNTLALTRNIAHVTAEVVPSIGQLALNATDGTLLRRSQVGLFEALARRPQAGVRIGAANGNGSGQVIPNVYDPIPFNCQGPNCIFEVKTRYALSSSNPDIGSFVEHEASSANPRQVELGPNQLPIRDEPRNSKGELNAGGRFNENAKGEPINEEGEVVGRNQSAIFCAYNEGTTVVSIAAGGLTYSEPVTVRGGSVEYPCGTVPLKNPPPRVQPVSSVVAVPSTPPAPAPVSPGLQVLSPPPPALPVPPPVVHRVAVRPPPPPLVPPLAAAAYPLLALVPPPAPTVARPTPPSGTAPVTIGSTVAQQEEEDEEAIEQAHNMAVYEQPDPIPPEIWTLGLIPIAALAAFGLRPPSKKNEPRYARAALRSGGVDRLDQGGN